jgi:hypothetical protein
VVIGIGIATLVGLALSWPRGTAPDLGAQPNLYVDATVKSVDRSECEVVNSDRLTGCQRATVTLESGRDKGGTGVFLVGGHDRDRVRGVLSGPRSEPGHHGGSRRHTGDVIVTQVWEMPHQLVELFVVDP